MDSFNLYAILKVLGEYGPLGLVILLWYLSDKRLTTLIETHRVEMTATQAQYGRDMTEQREMYKTNASLCRDFSSVASDLREIVIMNIEKMTRVDDAIRQNQFCPMQRVEKKQITVARES